MEEGRSALKMLVGRPRRRWECNIRMDLEEICINTRNWVDLSQGRDYWRSLVNTALNLRVAYAMELVNTCENATK